MSAKFIKADDHEALELCRILKLDPSLTRAFRIDVVAGSLITVTVTRFATPEEVREINELFVTETMELAHAIH